MFQFVALFALVAVAAAEPQWVHPYAVHNAAHLKTPSGDTVSVQAAKIQHHQLKANEYAKKAYVPYAYHSGVVAAPVSSAVYNMPATYAAATVPYTHGVYSGLFRGKREAEADSQYYTSAYAGVSPYHYNNVYNHGVYGAYSGLTGYSMPYSTYGMGIRHLGKREADADSQYYTSAYAGVSPYHYNNVYNNGVYGAYSGLTGYTMPYSTYGMGIRHLGKREAEADSQFYNNIYSGYPTYNNVYNTAGVYGRHIGYPTTTYGNVWNRFLY